MYSRTSFDDFSLKKVLDTCGGGSRQQRGEQTVTAAVLADLSARGISFFADGQVQTDITKYDLFREASHEEV